MTHVLVAIGSMGDLRPQLALARALMDRGADVLLLGLDDYADAASDCDVPFRGVGARLMGPIASPIVARAASRHQSVGALVLRRWIRACAPAIARALAAGARPGDVLVTGILGLPACRVLGAALGCEVVELALAPTLPTAHADSLVGAPRQGRSPINLCCSRALRHGSLMMGAPIARVLTGGRPTRRTTVRHGSDGTDSADSADGAVILACSPRLVPPAADWPAAVHCTGRLALPVHDWEPDAGLARFLRSGPPPVYVGFGSVPLRDPRAAVARQAEAARRAGVRVLIAPSPGFGSRHEAYGDHARLLGFVPHDWLLPRTAAAIHHGGAGTTHAALAAGVPQGVVPFSLDQPYYARRVAALGLGPAPLRPGSAGTRALAALMVELTGAGSARGYRERSRRAADAVAREDGARAAAELLLAAGSR